MKNKVTVSRAPRLRKCIYTQINVGGYYLADILDSSIDEYGIFPRWEDSVCPHFTLPYKVALETDEVIPFDSFDDMCKWVANGRKLEDLQGDTKNEWEQLRTLELGDFFMEAGKTYQIQNFGLAKDCTTIECWCLDDSSMVEFNNERLAWPVRFDLGDTITFGKITE